MGNVCAAASAAAADDQAGDWSPPIHRGVELLQARNVATQNDKTHLGKRPRRTRTKKSLNKAGFTAKDVFEGVSFITGRQGF